MMVRMQMPRMSLTMRMAPTVNGLSAEKILLEAALASVMRVVTVSKLALMELCMLARLRGSGGGLSSVTNMLWQKPRGGWQVDRLRSSPVRGVDLHPRV